MHNIIIDKPYRFVPPYKGTFWSRAFQPFLPVYLRRTFAIESVEFRGLAELERSLRSGNGILLTPNHCRACDPIVMGLLSKEVRQPFYYMASWHAFMEGKLRAWLLSRGGAFSVYREGVDREAIRASTEILATNERPLVLFPEGAISRTNDYLHPLLDGVSLIARAAAKERAHLHCSSSVAIHPVAIKYCLLTNVEASLHAVLDEIEARFCWRRQNLPLVERIVKVGEGLLALKEIEYLGQAQNGEIHDRLDTLIDKLLNPLEAKWLNGHRRSHFVSRVKALRAAILKEMLDGNLSQQETANRWQDLADVYLAVQLSCYPPYYVRSNPTPERLTETVERFEDDLTDNVRSHGRWRAVVQIGEAIEAGTDRENRKNGLTSLLQDKIQFMLDELNRELGRTPCDPKSTC